MQEDIRKWLVGCSMPVNEASRKDNELKIRNYKKENPTEFIYYVAQELNNQELPEAARHLAGVLFKNSVKSGDDQPYWYNFTDEQSEELKKLILSPMGDPVNSVRLATCSCIATVACLELPVKKWPEIINILWETSFDSDLFKKQSALMTLGYIWEELDSDVLDEESTGKIISALLEVIKDLNQTEEIMKIAIEAVLHSLIFAEKIFEENKGGVIIERVLGLANYNSPKVGSSIMMCLAEIVRLYYDYVHDYMEDIKNVTFEAMKGDFEDDVKTLAIEVWCSLCEQEIFLKKRNYEQCKNYTEQIYEELVNLMLILLNSSDIDEDDDTDTWNTSTAAGWCLHLISQNVGDKIVESVIGFVAQKIGEGAGWKDKYFGLLALGAILEGPSKEQIKQVLSPAMTAILALYSDESRKIRETTAWFFSRVAQSHCELLETQDFFPSLYEKVTLGLKDEIKVAWNSATIITELAKNLAPVEGQNRNILSSVYENLIDQVLACAYRNEEVKHHYGRPENKITIAGFDALYSLFEHAPPDVEKLLLQSLEHFYKLLKETTEIQGELDERAKDMQSFIWVWIQTILNRITQSLDEVVAKSLVDVILDCFKIRADVFEEGFLLLSALCSKFGKHMDHYVEDIGPFIFHALKESDSSDTIKNACGLISDLCTMVESEKIINGYELYVPLLHGIMSNPKLQREAKLGAVTAIGDTFLMTREKFLPFLEDTLNLFASAANQCVNANTNDEDLVNYVVKLQGALIESYTCIIQEVNDSQETYKMVEPHVSDIAQFCIICVHDKYSPNLQRLKEVAGLIGDLASIYQNKNYYPIEDIEKIVEYLRNTEEQEACNIAEWIINNMSMIM